MSRTLATALTTWMTEGHAIPTGEDFHQDLVRAVNLAGGQRAAGRLLGVPESSLRRWLGGARPRRQVDLVRPIRRLFAGRQRFVDAYNGYMSMVVTANVTYSSDTRSRQLHVGREISIRRIQAVLRAWEDGNDRTAHNNLSRAIKEDYFRIDLDEVEPGRQFVTMRGPYGIAFE